MTKDRLKVTDTLLHDVDVDVKLDVLKSDIADWEQMIEEAGGIAGTGHIDSEFYGYDGGRDLTIKYTRLENDKEYAARMKTVEMVRENKRKAKAKKDASDRKTYERLKKKFEGK